MKKITFLTCIIPVRPWRMWLIFLFLIFNFPSFSQNWYALPWIYDPNYFTFILSFYGDSNRLYIGGCFQNIISSNGDTMPACDIMAWDGIGLDNLNGGISNTYITPAAITKYNDEIYIAGDFGAVDNVPYTQYIARWDGNNWNNLGSLYAFTAASSELEALCVYNNGLYIGGGYMDITPLDPADGFYGLAKWDGTTLSSVAGGIYWSTVQCLAVYKNELYIGGIFDNLSYNILRWDGTQYKPVGEGLPGAVGCMAVDTINDFLYLAGGFGMVRWNGKNFKPTADFITDNPPAGYALFVYHGELYSGGGFIGWNSDGDTLRNIARWDGEKWKPLGYGTNNSIRGMGVWKDTLYVGGHFAMVGNDSGFTDSVSYIAQWYTPPEIPCTWLQAEIYYEPDTIYFADTDTVHFENNIRNATSYLWDFGDGTTAEGKQVSHSYADTGTYLVSVIVHYQDCYDTAYTTITILPGSGTPTSNIKHQTFLNIFPNPTKDGFIIEVYVAKGEGYLQIQDIKGNLIDEYAVKQGKSRIFVNTSAWSKGVYFCSLKADGKVVVSKKMVVE